MAINVSGTLTPGDDVYGSDGEKLGKVVAADANYVVVEKGWFFPTDYYIPTNAIASYADGQATLTVTKDAALNQGWDVAPETAVTETEASTTYVEEPVTGTYTTDEVVVDAQPGNMYATDTPNLAPVDDTAYTTSTSHVDDLAVDAGAGDTIAADGVTVDDAVTAAPAAEYAGDETLTVPVYAEELVATTQTHEVGGARIEKSVEAVEQTLDVPVTEERLRVVRRTVDRDVAAADATGVFEDVIVDVPITVEEVDVSTRARVAEEIVIQREQIERTEQVQGTVRREHVEVTEAAPGAIDDDTLVDMDPADRR